MNVFSKVFIASALAFTSLASHAVAQDAKNDVMTVTGSSITNEFKENESIAEKKYKDKQIQITGYVVSVKKNEFDIVLIGLSDEPNASKSVVLMPIDEMYPYVKNYNKGDKITYVCNGAFKIFLAQLQSCYDSSLIKK